MKNFFGIGNMCKYCSGDGWVFHSKNGQGGLTKDCPKCGGNGIINNIKMIEEIIKCETELEKTIISDKDFIEGALWGKPRNGHPEGKVFIHIGEDEITGTNKQDT
jgi:DnaJ-class molecular chaperone